MLTEALCKRYGSLKFVPKNKKGVDMATMW